MNNNNLIRHIRDEILNRPPCENGIEDIRAELDDPDGSKVVLDEMLAKMRESKRIPTYLANEERRKELEERYKRE